MPIWNEAMNLAEEIFKLPESFPKKEDYCLTSQLRRAALSISANIAEAYGLNHRLDKINIYPKLVIRKRFLMTAIRKTSS